MAHFAEANCPYCEAPNKVKVSGFLVSPLQGRKTVSRCDRCGNSFVARWEAVISVRSETGWEGVDGWTPADEAYANMRSAGRESSDAGNR